MRLRDVEEALGSANIRDYAKELCSGLTRIENSPGTSIVYNSAKVETTTTRMAPIRYPIGSSMLARMPEPPGGTGIKKGFAKPEVSYFSNSRSLREHKFSPVCLYQDPAWFAIVSIKTYAGN